MLKAAAELSNQTFKVPYIFMFKRVKKPPRKGYCTSLIFMIFCIIIYGYLVSQYAFNIIKQRHKKCSTSTGNRTFLTTTEAGSRAPLFFDSDGTTFVVDNAANTSVCNASRLFIGPLIDYNVTLDTENGNRGLSLKTGPKRISWENDNG